DNEKEEELIEDLCGKKVRVAENLKSVFKVYTNDIVYFCSSDVYSLIANNNDKSKIIPLNIKSEVIEKNDIKKISMKDGTMNFDIIDKDKIFLKAIAKDTGVVRGGKGCNIPGADLGENSLNDKDKENLKWAIDNNIDIIGQSYVESSRDILCVREYIKKVKGNQNDIKIFSKLETIIGLNNYKEIMNCSDGIVIARGDLVPECGMEISVEQEFELLKKLRDDKYNKEIIIATHVLDSMKSRLNSNINEIESIYTFINNGATGFLLAGETSIGKYPVQTAKLLNELIKRYKKY
uniref:pyruvate kinase n=1 Tax=Clostridium cuniculi TaxID=2548455 RepID=UPI0018A89A64